MATKLLEKPDITICEWTAALYQEKKRKWVYGCLSVKSSEIIFIDTSDNNAGKKLVTIRFEDVIDVQKATPGLVFGAVYILKKNNEKIWLSSLPDREGVFGALKHFWRKGLIKEEDGRRNIHGRRTEMGQKLLGIVTDSEQTLNKAAVQLVEQGHQIDNALSTMADLHSDLDIVENFVDDLQSWVGRWRMPEQYETIDPVFVNKSEIPEVFEYEVLFSKLQIGSTSTKSLGDLRISKGGLTILTPKKRTEHHYNWGDVSQLRVVTPWEMIVIQNKIGKPDLKYSLISANMVAILKLLDKCAKYKLKYDTPPDRVVCIKSGSSTGNSTGSFKDNRSSSRGVTDHSLPMVGVHKENTAFSGNQFTSLDCDTEIQINQSQRVVSDMEANEISHALAGLKSLALSVQGEESRQNERLDSLAGSVDKANERLVVNERKVKNMIN